MDLGGQIVGRIKVTEISQRDDYVQIAYDTVPTSRNKGYMTEAVKGVIEFLFNEVGVNRVYSQCRASNIASVRVLQKAGMTHEGILRKHYYEGDGNYTDVDVYGILKEDLVNN